MHSVTSGRECKEEVRAMSIRARLYHPAVAYPAS